MPDSTLGSLASGAATGAALGTVVPGVGNVVGALVGGGIGLVSGLFGASQRAKAKKLAEQNAFPNEPIPAEVLQAEKMAEQDANTGLPSEQYNLAKQNIARQQATALQAANERRGGLMTVAANQQAGDDANLALDVQNANARIQNRRQLAAVKNNVGQWQDKTWDWNSRTKYQQTAAAARALMGAGNANLNQGLDRIAGAATGYFGRGGSLFGGGSSGGNGGLMGQGNIDPYGYDMQGQGNDQYDTTG